MWILSFLLLVAFSGALGQLEGIEQDLDRCGRGMQELKFEELEEKGGQEQMEIICPAILEALKCVDKLFEEEFSSSMEDLVEIFESVAEEEVAKLLRVAVNTKSMITDLCTEGTQLNTDVKEHMECFESIDEEEVGEECRSKAVIYDVFTDISNEVEEADDDFEPDAVCERNAFMAACLSYAIHEKCGQEAFKTFNTIIKRTTIFPNMVCSVEKLQEMKDTLANRLDMPEAEKDIFKLALDLKRRRK